MTCAVCGNPALANYPICGDLRCETKHFGDEQGDRIRENLEALWEQGDFSLEDFEEVFEDRDPCEFL